MRIVVAGCGKIGTVIINSLVKEGHDLLAIDVDQSAIDSVNDIIDIMGVCGSATDCDVLSEAEIGDANLFVATTGSDELNMLSCHIARKMGAEHTIARIRNPEYNEKSLHFLCHELNLSMSINPDRFAASEIYNILKFPSAVKIEYFSDRIFELIELVVAEGSDFDGLLLSETRNRFKALFLICSVQRGSDVFIPSGDFKLEAGDRVWVAAPRTEIDKMLRETGFLKKQARDIMIVGGSKLAYYLARSLSAEGNNVKIIEKSKERCSELCVLLNGVTIINGNGNNKELLLEEGLDSVDAFISLTGIDEENIVYSILAKAHNVPSVIAKINNDELASMADRLGIDVVISPKTSVVDTIVRYVRALHKAENSKVEKLYKMMDDKAEIVEFIIENESRLTGVPIKDINFKPDILILGILRDRKPIIPSGNDCIKKNDRVIVISSKEKLRDISEIVKS